MVKFYGVIVIYYVEGSEAVLTGINLGWRVLFATFSTFKGFNVSEL